jgi:hypothetical protein
MVQLVKRELAAFAVGILVGVVVAAAYFTLSGRGSQTEPPSMAASEPLPKTTPPLRQARRHDNIRRDTQSSSNTVLSDKDSESTHPKDSQPSDTLTVPFVPPQYLPLQLQDALRQYPTLDDPASRSALVDRVLAMTETAATGQVVAQALEMIFHQESTAKVKLDILNDLILLDEPYSIISFLEGIDPNQPQEVRAKAIDALGNLGDPRAVPFLQQFIADPDPDIRDAAKNALEALADAL